MPLPLPRVRARQNTATDLPQPKTGCTKAEIGAVLLATMLTLTSCAEVGHAETQSQAVDWLQGYLRIDTTNPPGNEAKGVDYLAKILHENGHDVRRFVSGNGRASLLAKFESENPAAKPLLLLHHIDVVPSGEGWSGDPFSGDLVDGTIFGRGAIDSKSLGIAHLAAFLELAENAGSLDRDLWFMASADEEAGGREGVGWILERYPDQLGTVGAVLTEAGINRVANGEPVWWGIEVAQKRPLWLRLSTRARGGHGSGYHPASATHTLIRGLDRLLAIELRPRLSPSSYLFFRSMTPFYGPAFGKIFDLPSREQSEAALEAAIKENRLHKSLLPGMTNYLRDTLQVTTVTNDSTSVNVISAEATATVDIRLLPDTNEEEFLETVKQTLGDAIDVEVLLRADPVPEPSIETEVYQRLASYLELSAPVVPTFIPGTTDSRYFRALNIPAYGFSPFLLTGAEARGIHGANESIPLQRFSEGVERMVQAVKAVVSPQR